MIDVLINLNHSSFVGEGVILRGQLRKGDERLQIRRAQIKLQEEGQESVTYIQHTIKKG